MDIPIAQPPDCSVLEFVSRHCGVSPSRLGPFSELGRDLGLDGDDAADFLDAFSHNFRVDMSEFDFSRHFGPEAALTPFSLLRWLIGAGPKLVPITIQELELAERAGKWPGTG